MIGIYRGSTYLPDIEVGPTPLREVFVGSTKVWPSSDRSDYVITSGDSGIGGYGFVKDLSQPVPIPIGSMTPLDFRGDDILMVTWVDNFDSTSQILIIINEDHSDDWDNMFFEGYGWINISEAEIFVPGTTTQIEFNLDVEPADAWKIEGNLVDYIIEELV